MSSSTDETMNSIIKDALDAIAATDKSIMDSKSDEVHRGMDLSSWTKFCERVGKGQVKPTCVIDFPWADHGGLNFQGNDRKLERMYCYDDPVRAKAEGVSGDRRVVVHAHTNLRWGDRLKNKAEDRALVLTSVNVRYATRAQGAASYTQEHKGFIVVPVSSVSYQALYKQGNEQKLEWCCTLRPCPSTPADVPLLDNKKASETRYNELRQVLALGESISGSAYFTSTKKETTETMRGESEFEVVGVSSLDALELPSMLEDGEESAGGSESDVNIHISGEPVASASPSLDPIAAPPSSMITCPSEAREIAPEPHVPAQGIQAAPGRVCAGKRVPGKAVCCGSVQRCAHQRRVPARRGEGL